MGRKVTFFDGPEHQTHERKNSTCKISRFQGMHFLPYTLKECQEATD